MRDLSNISADMTNTGSEPVLILEIWWDDYGTIKTHYATTELGDGSQIPGNLSLVSGFDSVTRIRGSNFSGRVDVAIEDKELSLFNTINDTDLLNRYCLVYLTHRVEGRTYSESNRSLLFTGRAASPMAWDPNSRTLRFPITTDVESYEIGITNDQCAFSNVDEQWRHEMWPLVFGTVPHVEGVKVSSRLTGYSGTTYEATTLAELLDMYDDYSVYLEAKFSKDKVDALFASEDNSWPKTEQYIEANERVTDAYTRFQAAYDRLVMKIGEDKTREYLTWMYEAATQQRSIVTYETQLLAYRQELDVLEKRMNALGDYSSTEVNTMRARYFELRDTVIPDMEAAVSAARSAHTSARTSLRDKYAEFLYFGLTKIIVEGGTNFPQSRQTLNINNARIEGTMSGNVFTVEDILPTYYNINFKKRDADPQTGTQYNTFELTDSDYPNLKGHYCLINHTSPYQSTRKVIIYVTDQVDTVCYYAPMLHTANEQGAKVPLVLDSGDDILETSPILIKDWFTELDFSLPEVENGLATSEARPWILEINSPIYEDAMKPEVWVVNATRSTVKNVYGYRTVNGRKIFTPLPSTYYRVSNNFNASNNHYITAITLKRPLTSFLEGWDDKLYVTVSADEYESAVYYGGGVPGNNAAEAIRWLVERFTNYAVSGTMFAAVAADVEKYPINFVLRETINLWDLIEQMAYQSRCAVWLDKNVVKIKYLSKAPASVDFTVDDSHIIQNTLRVTFSNIEDIYTQFEATWKEHPLLPQRTQVIRNNIPKYGLRKKTVDFYCYTNKEYVAKSLTFWTIRESSMWKIVEFDAPLSVLALQPFDYVAIDLEDTSILGPSVAYGMVESSIYDHVRHVVRVRIKTSVRMGEVANYPLFWPSSVSTAFPYVTDTQVGGQANTNIVLPQDTGDWRAAGVEFGSRAHDVGKAQLNDSSDPSYTNPYTSYSEHVQQLPAPQTKVEKRRNLILDLQTTKIFDPDTGGVAPLSQLLTVSRVSRYGYTRVDESTGANVLALKGPLPIAASYPVPDGEGEYETVTITAPFEVEYHPGYQLWLPYRSITQPFLGQILESNAISPNKWVYVVQEVVPVAGGGYADTTRQYRRTVAAYNLLEWLNDGTGIEGVGVNTNAADWPGWPMKPIGNDVYKNLVIVYPFVSEEGDGSESVRYVFQATNVFDGVCPT